MAFSGHMNRFRICARLVCFHGLIRQVGAFKVRQVCLHIVHKQAVYNGRNPFDSPEETRC